jgi:hypothetical protein
MGAASGKPPDLRPALYLLGSVFYRRGIAMKHFVLAAVFFVLAALPAPAQRLVDPAAVAPEYREAAEKRRAEQIKQRDCAHKADAEKIVPRERTAFVIHCLESAEAK